MTELSIHKMDAAVRKAARELMPSWEGVVRGLGAKSTVKEMIFAFDFEGRYCYAIYNVAKRKYTHVVYSLGKMIKRTDGPAPIIHLPDALASRKIKFY